MTIFLRVWQVLIPVMIGIGGQLFMKVGMTRVGEFGSLSIFQYFLKAFTNIPVLIGFSLYFLSSLFWMMVLAKEDLSFAYPLLSMGYIIILVASMVLFKEDVSAVRWLGALVIMAGVVLISRS